MGCDVMSARIVYHYENGVWWAESDEYARILRCG